MSRLSVARNSMKRNNVTAACTLLGIMLLFTKRRCYRRFEQVPPNENLTGCTLKGQVDVVLKAQDSKLLGPGLDSPGITLAGCGILGYSFPAILEVILKWK